jgi:Transglutaminase-like superfamily
MHRCEFEMQEQTKNPQPDNRPFTPAHRYFIGELIFARATRHGVVLLDLKRNRYFGLGSTDALALSECVDGFPRNEHWMDSAHQTPVSNSSEACLLESLVQNGILTMTPPMKGDVVSADIALNGDLVSIGDEIVENKPVRAGDVASFLVTFLWSAASLRCRPLRSVVRSVYQRRSAAIARGYTFNLSRASELVDTFRSIRPYFFLARNNCLQHALALVNYLAAHGEFPVWVFGVTTDPWTAHSWVQQEHYLLDSNPEAVCSLEPILAV